MIKVKKAEPRKHKRVVLGGEPDIGKSTAAAKWCNNALWVDLDKRIPAEVVDNCSVLEGIRDYNSLKIALKSVLDEPKLEYNGLVIDTMTILESMAKDYSITQDYKGNANNYADFSKGEKTNLPIHVNSILSILDRIGEKHGIDVIIICHSEIKPEKNPNGDNYDKVALSLTKTIRSRVMQWADYVGFAWLDVKVEESGLTKVGTSGKRMVSFCNNPRWDAKGSNVAEVEFDIDGNWMEGLKATPVVEVAKKSGLVTKEHK